MKYDVAIIGGGPAGYTAAEKAAAGGLSTVLFEKNALGGVCLNEGCVPTKTLLYSAKVFDTIKHAPKYAVSAENPAFDFPKIIARKNKVVKKLTAGIRMKMKENGVEVVSGEAEIKGRAADGTITIASGEAVYEAANLLICTGSETVIPPIPGLAETEYWTSREALLSKELPTSLVIIGGGVIGAELGGAYANLGAEVTILEGSPQILPTYEKDLVKLVEDDFKKKGVTVVTNAMAKEAVDNGDSVTVKYAVDGKEESVTADYVMVTVGRRPNTDDMGLEQAGVEVGERGLITVDKQGRTNVPNIYAIGDIVPGAALAHKASYEAKIAAEAISGKKVAVDYKAMPAVAFTDPELASVGMTIKEAKDAGIEAKAYKFPFSGNGRALSLGKTEGFIRLVTTIEDNVLIGAQIGGVGASDMVSELALAIESGMNAEDIALTIHPHPSLGEIVMDASELALGLPIHI